MALTMSSPETRARQLAASIEFLLKATREYDYALQLAYSGTETVKSNTSEANMPMTETSESDLSTASTPATKPASDYPEMEEEKPKPRFCAAEFMLQAVKDAGPGAELPLSPPAKAAPKSKLEKTLKKTHVRLNDDFGSTSDLVTIRQVKWITMQNRKTMVVGIDAGWESVIPKTFNVKEGDYVFFFKPDAFIPANIDGFTRFEDIGTRLIEYNGVSGYRVTIRQVDKGVTSQGFVALIQEFPGLKEKAERVISQAKKGAVAGDEGDFTQDMGVLKWRLHHEASLSKLGPTPIFVPSSDIQNGQDCPNFWTKAKYRSTVYQETSKMDGCTMSCYFIKKGSPWWKFLPALPKNYDARMVHENGRFGVCSRNKDRNNVDPKGVDRFWQTAIESKLHEIMPRLDRNMVIQGELVGSTIQRNAHGYPQGLHDFFVFTIRDLDSKRPMGPREVVDLAKQLGLKHVEVRGYVKLPQISTCHHDLQVRADLTNREGLVYKSCGRDGRSFKILSGRWAFDKEILLDRSGQGGPGKSVTSILSGQDQIKETLLKWREERAAEEKMWEFWGRGLSSGDFRDFYRFILDTKEGSESSESMDS